MDIASKMRDKGLRFSLNLKEPKTLSELKLITVSQTIRRKPFWREKMKNPQIVTKWKEEIAEQGVTPSEFEYILDELNYYANMEDSVEVGPVDGTWQSDELIDQSLLTSFKELVYQLLEQKDESEKDYHPNSDNLVVDLVHPSLFCFVRGVSKIVDETGITADTINKLASDESAPRNSRYRWLPSEVSCNENGEVSIDSYINNLPPTKNADLYSSIARILSKFLPLFSRVLRDLAYPRDNRLSVIIKLANIELTPKKPKYKGGVWHVEGTESEAIVATGILYYSMENVTESLLKFRAAVDDPPYEQDDREGVYQVFGLENEGPLNQKLGSIVAREGRCIAFPNVYQHKVAPFELADKTKNGHRKILVFFLIDPMKRVISTRNIAPQNPIWDDKPADRFTITLDQAKKYREDLMSERKYVRDEQNRELYEREFSLCEH
ncbi:hypothetical protein Bhyg_16969 [Pseudolycoriella hygida]|uniref:Uncharacterized protein n=1 Tax=Pseudolycoriella hygida TaxID=35572 RepID=A0A9Q0RVS2_9DIPT|nr:hypothetical protein Bhyg_16969 [Pseudolycoriella hygida]